METITKVLLLLCVTILFAYSTGSGDGKLTNNDAAKIPAGLVRAHSSDTLAVPQQRFKKIRLMKVIV